MKLNDALFQRSVLELTGFPEDVTSADLNTVAAKFKNALPNGHSLSAADACDVIRVGYVLKGFDPDYRVHQSTLQGLDARYISAVDRDRAILHAIKTLKPSGPIGTALDDLP